MAAGGDLVNNGRFSIVTMESPAIDPGTLVTAAVARSAEVEWWASIGVPPPPPINTSNLFNHVITTKQVLKWAHDTCVVCGDRASGRHYGVTSCEGCKGFFKRCVRRKLQFNCRGNSDCDIQVSTRNRCQHCRLKKCVAMGMRSQSVLEERKPLSVVAPVKKKENGTHKSLLAPRRIVFDQLPAMDTLPPLTTLEEQQEGVLTFSDDESGGVTVANENEEPEPPTDEEMLMCDLSCDVLVKSLIWIQCAPQFQTLSKELQLSLLQQTWTEHFLLDFALNSATNIEFCAEKLMSLSKDQKNGECFNALGTLFKLVAKLNPTQEEVEALKLLSTFSPDRVNPEFGTEAMDSVLNARKVTEINLLGYLRNKAGCISEALRMAEVVWLLCPLRSLPVEFIEHHFCFTKSLSPLSSVGEVIPYIFKINELLPLDDPSTVDARINQLFELFEDVNSESTAADPQQE